MPQSVIETQDDLRSADDVGAIPGTGIKSPGTGGANLLRYAERGGSGADHRRQLTTPAWPHAYANAASAAAAIANSLASPIVSPVSISPTGASPGRWHGMLIEQRSRKLPNAVFRRISKFCRL